MSALIAQCNFVQQMVEEKRVPGLSMTGHLAYKDGGSPGSLGFSEPFDVLAGR